MDRNIAKDKNDDLIKNHQYGEDVLQTNSDIYNWNLGHDRTRMEGVQAEKKFVCE